MQAGAERFGAKTVQTEVLSVDLNPSPKRIVTDSGEYTAKAVIIATGADHRHLGLEGEAELMGRGVGYCAACDGMFYRGKTVAVVGGGNSAVKDALLLSKICKKVYLIHRRDTLRAEKIYHRPLLKTDNVEFLWNTTVAGFEAEEKLTALRLNTPSGEELLPVDGAFISIGRDPVTELFVGQVDLDPRGYIIADESTRTNLPGVFAAGDVRTKAFRQIVTAASDGAVAAHYAEEFIAQL